MNKSMKICSASYVISGLQKINNVPLHTYLLILMAKIQNTDNTFNC